MKSNTIGFCIVAFLIHVFENAFVNKYEEKSFGEIKYLPKITQYKWESSNLSRFYVLSLYKSATKWLYICLSFLC